MTAGGKGSGIRLPRRAPGQSVESYLDILVKQTELALQQIALGQAANAAPAAAATAQTTTT